MEDTDLLHPGPGDKKKTLTKCQIVMLVTGVLLVLFSVIMLAGTFGVMFDAIMKMEMEVQEGSISYKIWKKTPFPLILNLYVYNITNQEEFVQGLKPDLQECGPYVWREYHEKKNLEFHDNHTVTYFQQRWWIWDEELSGNNSLDDIIYTLNPVPVSAAWSVRNHPIYIALMNSVFNSLNERMVVEATVEELIFTGFHDPVLDWVQKNIISETGPYHFLLKIIDLPPGISSYNKFGWFYKRNNSLSYDGIFNMMTGTDDVHKVGQIDWWNYTRETPFFDSPCNAVSGSAGEFFEAGLERDNITFYATDLCMTMILFYKEDIIRNGLKAYRFWGSNHTFANGSMVPGNECYCVKDTCAPMGLINAESCRMGAPAFVSFPHYFNADPFLLDQVNGLSPPEEEKHSFIMDIMPEVGVPINVNARMQINMKVTPYPGTGVVQAGKIDIMKDLPDIYLPMIWFEETAALPRSFNKELKSLQFIMSTPTMTIIFSIVLLIGLCFCIYVVYVGIRLKFQPEESIDDSIPERDGST